MSGIRALLLILCLACICSCSAAKHFASIETKFLADVDTAKKLDNMPFQHSWVLDSLDRKQYDAIYVAPVSITELDVSKWKGSASSVITSEADYLKEAGEIALYFREQLTTKLKEYPDAHFKLASEPGPKVLVLTIALIEAQFSHPAAQAGALAVPVPGVGTALSAVVEPYATFAMRVTDGATGQLVATAADRKYPPARLVDLNKFKISSSLREIISNWSLEIADAANKGRLAKIESRGTISVLPW